MKKICVLGLGYIGIPTACMFATSGYQVHGVDIDENIIKIIKSRNCPIEEPGMKTLLNASLNSGNLEISNTPVESDIFIIAVPTPIKDDKTMDYTFLKRATEDIYPLLKQGNLVIVESTVTPGSTNEIVKPILEKSGLNIGEELFLAHCPERVLPGFILKELINNDRIIGGINEKSALMAKEVYKSFVSGEIFITDLTSAELTKVVENTYRDVNIAFSNELALVCDKLGVNVLDIIKFANRHPRVNILTPGPGVGGHCISVDPWFLIEKAPEITRITKLAREINDNMPKYVVNKTSNILKNIKNPKIGIFGVTFKGNIDDVRNSPAITVCDILYDMNINFKIYDPHVKYFKFELSDLETTITDSDLILLLADHKEFKYLSPEEIGSKMRNLNVFDTRNILDKEKWIKHNFNFVNI